MKTINKMLSLSLIGFALSGCAKTNILNSINVTVSPQTVGNATDTYVTLSADLNLGTAALSALQIPIADPRTGANVGSVGFATLANGHQAIEIALNETVILNADPTLGSMLPNGRALPASLGVPAGSMLGFQISQYSRLYIGGDMKSEVFIGGAFSIPALNGVTNVVGAAANVFFGQSINSNLYGLAGIYGSPTANESGIAVFGRLTLQPQTVAPVLTSTTSSGAATPVALAAKLLQQAQRVMTAATQVAPSATPARAPAAVTGTGSSLANKISSQACADSDQLHPASNAKVTNLFYGRHRVLKVQ